MKSLMFEKLNCVPEDLYAWSLSDYIDCVFAVSPNTSDNERNIWFQLKAVVIDDNLAILHQTNVQFDNDLPEFRYTSKKIQVYPFKSILILVCNTRIWFCRTYGGVIQRTEEPNVIVVPTLMWVKALDLILDKLRVCGVDFSKVSAVSGCAQVMLHSKAIDNRFKWKSCLEARYQWLFYITPFQQHGTVYWNKGSRNRLQRLDPIKFLHEQFATSFSVTHSPVWMDSSTVEECDVLEEIAGGPQVRLDRKITTT